MCCSVLQCAAVLCSVLQCVPMCCSVLQCVVVLHSVLQCVAVCCSVLQCVAVCCSVLQCVAVCCSVLQCVAVYSQCFSVLQYVHIQEHTDRQQYASHPTHTSTLHSVSISDTLQMYTSPRTILPTCLTPYTHLQAPFPLPV